MVLSLVLSTNGAVEAAQCTFQKLPRLFDFDSRSVSKQIMVPVQVGNRIVDSVDPCRAASMARGNNVTVVMDRRTKSIKRLILTPRELGLGCVDEPSAFQNSRKTTRVEELFTGDAPVPDTIGGTRWVFAHKPSSVFSKSSGPQRIRAKGCVPTTAAPHSSAARSI